MSGVVVCAYNLKYLRPAGFQREKTHLTKKKRKKETVQLIGCAAAKHLKCLGASCLLGNLRGVFLLYLRAKHMCIGNN